VTTQSHVSLRATLVCSALTTIRLLRPDDHFVNRDDVLKRMLPRWRSLSPPRV